MWKKVSALTLALMVGVSLGFGGISEAHHHHGPVPGVDKYASFHKSLYTKEGIAILSLSFNDIPLCSSTDTFMLSRPSGASMSNFHGSALYVNLKCIGWGCSAIFYFLMYLLNLIPENSIMLIGLYRWYFLGLCELRSRS